MGAVPPVVDGGATKVSDQQTVPPPVDSDECLELALEIGTTAVRIVTAAAAAAYTAALLVITAAITKPAPPLYTPPSRPQQQLSASSPSSPLPSPNYQHPTPSLRVSRQLGYHIVGRKDRQELRPGRPLVQSHAHRIRLLSLLVEEKVWYWHRLPISRRENLQLSSLHVRRVIFRTHRCHMQGYARASTRQSGTTP